ncbi:MAG: 3-oxoacyl-[acyl-carrier-protein] reductase [Planctomycetota bacterium]|nr:MAG: 3-oxoacyl-[acyl-carrier-protein] reductase [Planctomycetota bacterium]
MQNHSGVDRIGFESKTVVITGASRGIGLEIARAFAEAGASLALISRSEEGLQRVCEGLRTQASQKCFPYPTDVRQKVEVERTIERIREDFGAIHVLVHNAGITRDGLIARMQDQAWQDVLDTNLNSAFWLTRSVSKVMIRQREGSILYISSVVGLRGNAGQSNYAASKAGLIGLGKSLAKELGSRNIRVNIVAPGFIETEMIQQLSPQQKERILANIPLRRLGRPKEIASICLFLASSWASYITGSVIQADGGLFA